MGSRDKVKGTLFMGKVGLAGVGEIRRGIGLARLGLWRRNISSGSSSNIIVCIINNSIINISITIIIFNTCILVKVRGLGFVLWAVGPAWKLSTVI